MGACGCGDQQPDYKFQGPKGVWYALTIYPGCAYCETPAGVIVSRHKPKELQDFLLGVRDMPFREEPDEFAVPLVDAKHVNNAFCERVGRDVWSDIRDVMDGTTYNVVTDAVYGTLAEFEKNGKESQS